MSLFYFTLCTSNEVSIHQNSILNEYASIFFMTTKLFSPILMCTCCTTGETRQYCNLGAAAFCWDKSCSRPGGDEIEVSVCFKSFKKKVQPNTILSGYPPGNYITRPTTLFPWRWLTNLLITAELSLTVWRESESLRFPNHRPSLWQSKQLKKWKTELRHARRLRPLWPPPAQQLHGGPSHLFTRR